MNDKIQKFCKVLSDITYFKLSEIKSEMSRVQQLLEQNQDPLQHALSFSASTINYLQLEQALREIDPALMIRAVPEHFDCSAWNAGDMLRLRIEISAVSTALDDTIAEICARAQPPQTWCVSRHVARSTQLVRIPAIAIDLSSAQGTTQCINLPRCTWCIRKVDASYEIMLVFPDNELHITQQSDVEVITATFRAWLEQILGEIRMRSVAAISILPQSGARSAGFTALRSDSFIAALQEIAPARACTVCKLEEYNTPLHKRTDLHAGYYCDFCARFIEENAS